MKFVLIFSCLVFWFSILISFVRSEVLPVPGDCTKYQICDVSGCFVFNCGPGTEFNPRVFVCDYPLRDRESCGSFGPYPNALPNLYPGIEQGPVTNNQVNRGSPNSHGNNRSPSTSYGGSPNPLSSYANGLNSFGGSQSPSSSYGNGPNSANSYANPTSYNPGEQSHGGSSVCSNNGCGSGGDDGNYGNQNSRNTNSETQNNHGGGRGYSGNSVVCR